MKFRVIRQKTSSGAHSPIQVVMQSTRNGVACALSRATPKTDIWRSTTARPNGRCAPSLLDGNTICSPAPIYDACIR
jgi:hypothetical protein